MSNKAKAGGSFTAVGCRYSNLVSVWGPVMPAVPVAVSISAVPPLLLSFTCTLNSTVPSGLGVAGTKVTPLAKAALMSAREPVNVTVPVPLPVTTAATLSPLSKRPASAIFLNPAKAVTPAGSPNTPLFLASSGIAERISSSVTVTAVPPEALTARRAFAQLRGAPTDMLSAIVSAGENATRGAPLIIASYIGFEPCA